MYDWGGDPLIWPTARNIPLLINNKLEGEWNMEACASTNLSPSHYHADSETCRWLREFNSNLGNILPEVKRIYVLAQVMHVDRHFQGDVVSLEVLAVQIPISYPTVGDIVEGI